MVYRMRLQEVPFSQIKSGMKTIELRLFDEKRRPINIGDKIIFQCISDESAQIAVIVKALYRYASFCDLFEEVPREKCGITTNDTIRELAEQMRCYYSEEAEEIFGVLGIKFELTDLEAVIEEQKHIADNEYEKYFPDGMK